ncbi:hypothetical protein LCGC14_2098850, partial [marine sediment metagenome]
IVHTVDPDEADALLVNTCGFIEDAKRESIDEVLTLMERKRDGQRLIVLGCLSKRYMDELSREMPEVDAFFGIGQAAKIAEFLSGRPVEYPALPANKVNKVTPLILAAPTFAPLKAAEGCSRRCGFCVIPSIRGPYKSRALEEVLAEARGFLKRGIKELLVVAQDLSSYGRDLLGGYGLPELLHDLATLEDTEYRVRPLYLYPTEVSGRLLQAISGHERVCSYFDIPLQHSEDRILKAMGRGGSRKKYLELIRTIRRDLPDAAIRTTMIVGFPGESEDEFSALLEFVEEAGFDHLGAFGYSDEEGTPAASLEDKVPQEVVERRLEELMGIQAEISREHNEQLVGCGFRVLVDECVDEGVIARLERQAPDVDGVLYLSGCDAKVGEFVDVEITGASDYDLEGVCP